MVLTALQVKKLLDLIIKTEPDDLDCDSCFEDLACFADAEIVASEISFALQAVRNHLAQCPCCQDEYKALLDSLRQFEELDACGLRTD